MTLLQVALGGAETCFRHHEREPRHKTLTRGLQRRRQIGLPYPLVFKNTRITQTPRQAGRPTGPNRQSGQGHTAQTRSLRKPPHTPFVEGLYRSAQVSVLLVDSQATWVDVMGAHAEAIKHSTPMNRPGGPSVHEFSGKRTTQ